MTRLLDATILLGSEPLEGVFENLLFVGIAQELIEGLHAAVLLHHLEVALHAALAFTFLDGEGVHDLVAEAGRETVEDIADLGDLDDLLLTQGFADDAIYRQETVGYNDDFARCVGGDSVALRTILKAVRHHDEREEEREENHDILQFDDLQITI